MHFDRGSRGRGGGRKGAAGETVNILSDESKRAGAWRDVMECRRRRGEEGDGPVSSVGLDTGCSVWNLWIGQRGMDGLDLHMSSVVIELPDKRWVPFECRGGCKRHSFLFT